MTLASDYLAADPLHTRARATSVRRDPLYVPSEFGSTVLALVKLLAGFAVGAFALGMIAVFGWALLR